MKRRLLMIMISLLLPLEQVRACSAFGSSSPQFSLLAKSYDWQLGGGIALINKRHLRKVALVSTKDQPVEWTSQYGSLTFTQFGRDFPLSGMNEKGLAIEILWDEDAPKGLRVSQGLNEAQWIQFQLDTAGSVAEMVANAGRVRMIRSFAPVHYFACDFSGECATFEFRDNQIVINRAQNLEVKVLTNNDYQRSLEQLHNYTGFGGDRAIPFGSSFSVHRFVIVASQLALLNRQPDFAEALDTSWKILDSVRQGRYSVWQLVHNLHARQTSFRSLGETSGGVKTIDLTSFDLNCSTPAQILDLDSGVQGSVNGAFRDFDPQLNRRVIETSARALNLPQALVDAVAAYPETTRCME